MWAGRRPQRPRTAARSELHPRCVSCASFGAQQLRRLVVPRWSFTEGRAPTRERACTAGGLTRMAASTPVPDDVVAQHRPVAFGEQRADGMLDLDRIRLLRPPEPAHESTEMSVDGDTRDVERVAEHDVGRLATHTRQRHEVGEATRNLTVELLT